MEGKAGVREIHHVAYACAETRSGLIDSRDRRSKLWRGAALAGRAAHADQLISTDDSNTEKIQINES